MCNCCPPKSTVCAAALLHHGTMAPWHARLQACSITPLVKNAEALVRASRRVLGDGFTFGLMRHTFMKQFCAGGQRQGAAAAHGSLCWWPDIEQKLRSSWHRVNDFGSLHSIALIRNCIQQA